MKLNEEKPLVTVAIITRNRADSLRRTLTSIFELDYPNIEVIVVDNASTDHTQDVLKGFKNIISFFSPQNSGFSKTRQFAIEAASGEYIAWCDDDCVPEKQWLSAFVERFESDATIALLGGRILNINFPPSLKFKGTEIMIPNAILKPVEDPYEALYYANLNMAIRTSHTKAVGGYDPFFKGGYEEVDLNLTFRKAGYKVDYEPKAFVNHYHNHVSFKKGRWFYGGSLMRLYLYFKHREMIGDDTFLSTEIKLFAKDFWRSFKLTLSGVKRVDGKRTMVGLIELFNTISSRVAIPWLIFVIHKNKKQSA